LTSETSIQTKVKNYAKKKGWIAIKLSTPTSRGWPDFQFLKSGRVFFIEFKAPDEQPSEYQDHIIKILQLQKFSVYVVDNVETGKSIINAQTRHVAQLPGSRG